MRENLSKILDKVEKKKGGLRDWRGGKRGCEIEGGVKEGSRNRDSCGR